MNLWFRRYRLLKRFLIILTLCVLGGCSQPNGEALPQLGIDDKQTSASGLSAGAYMAGQLQLAHSHEMIGAALVAGDRMAARKRDLEFCLPPPGM
jgi:hypothetical protein